MNPDLEKMNLQELKALAYDCISQIEGVQQILKKVNERIGVEISKAAAQHIMNGKDHAPSNTTGQ
jgi:hypothetical protein